LDDDEFGIPSFAISKSDQEEIRFAVGEYKGHEYIDIRSYFRSPDGFRPTKKGITLKPALYGELLKGVFQVGLDLGLIDEDKFRRWSEEENDP
jgi:hypothetical protein